MNRIHLDIAILGGGFAGVYCAKTVCRQLGSRSGLKVGLVSEENYMVFQPMLPEVAGSSISPRHVVNPLRLLCRHARILRGKVQSIDWPARRLVLDAGRFSANLEIHFQELVLTLGAVTDLSRIPGMPEHAFLLRNVGDAMFLRSTLIGRIEEADLQPPGEIKRRLLTFVVVGGGYSGVETAGHILDLFHSILSYYPNVTSEDLQVCLVHSGDHLLPTLNRSLGEYSARKLERRGLKLLLNRRVKSVTAHRVHFEDAPPIETSTVICTVGNASHPLVTALGEQCKAELVKGRLATEATGQVKGQSHLWAAGDCSAFPAIAGGQCPGTAQFAMRQGILVGRNLALQARGRTLQRFTFKGLGEMASIGHRVAVADILGMRFSGFFAWWLWRSVYLFKLPRLDRKLRVILDWTLDLFFPRDLNHLSPRFSRPLKEVYLERGDALFHSGEPAFSFYVVKSGALEIRAGTETIQRVAAGGYFGEQALLSDNVWHYEALAVEPTRLVSFPASLFHQLVQGAGSLGHFFQKSATKYQSREIVEAIGRKIPPEFVSQPIARLMERRLYTLTPHLTVRQAMQITRDHPRSSYPVVDAARRLLGTVTREDFYEFIKREDTTPETPIERMALATVPTVAATTSVADVMKIFIRSGANKVLVLGAAGQLEGIATVMDLMAAGASQAAGGGAD